MENSASLSGRGWVQDPAIFERRCVKARPKTRNFACHGVGDPIYPDDASKLQEDLDYSDPIGSLSFKRIYDSKRGGFIHNFAIDFLPPVKGEGRGCTSVYSATALVDGYFWATCLQPINQNAAFAKLTMSDGNKESFAWNGQIGVPVEVYNKDRLEMQVKNAEKIWILSLSAAKVIYVFNENGLLRSVNSIGGGVVDLIYSNELTQGSIASSPGLLIQVKNSFDRSLFFSYNLNGYLSSLVDPVGRYIFYSHEEPLISPGNSFATFLKTKSVTYQDGGKKIYLWDEVGNIDGENTPGKVTGVIDEKGVRYSSTNYKNNAAVSTYLGDFSEKFSILDYRINGVGNVAVSDPMGGVRNWQYGLKNGISTLVGTTQPAGSGCVASTKSITYDGSGNVSALDDFNGHRTCFAHDPNLKLEITRVEGLTGQTGVNSSATPTSCSTVTGSGATLPNGSRKISTQWHPDWAIKTKQAEPKKLTTWVYNGQPDPFNGNQLASCTSASYGATSVAALPDGKPIVVLCKAVVQATLDATGAQGLSPTLDNLDATAAWQSTTSHTYNQYGQVLTSVDANNRTTTYTYYQSTAFTGTDPNAVGHYQGDLQTVTNAKGHITQYTSYDKAGRVLTMVDPNQVTTTYSYTPRGWLSTVNQAGQLTSYDYWPTGLLKKVTSPDTSTLSYTYDDAHRLTDVTDQLGNTVHYTLDNAGNRIGEDVKDTSTALTRNISRVYDALNRLEKVTGAAQ